MVGEHSEVDLIGDHVSPRRVSGAENRTTATARRVGENVTAFLLGIWTAAAMSVTVANPEGPSAILNLVDGIGPSWGILALGLAFAYRRVILGNRFPRSLTAALLSALISGFTVVGLSYYHLESWDFVVGSPYQVVFALAVFGGYFALYYAAMVLLIAAFDRWNGPGPLRQGTLIGMFDRRTAGVSAAVIFVCWLPSLIAFFPGSVPHDGLIQLNMYFGEEPFTNYHPVLVTALMGWAMEFGRLFGSDDLGVFTYVLVQAVLFAMIAGYSVRTIHRLGAPRWLAPLTLAVFAVLPLWSAWAQTELKDTLFTAAYLLFSTLLVSILARRGDPSARLPRFVLLALAGVLAALSRNNGVFVVVPALILTVIVVTKRQRIAMIAVIAVIVGAQGTMQYALMPALGIQNGPVKEALSLPFQQTARYLKEHGTDVSSQERAAINAVLPVDHLAERYNPEIADPVKNLYRLDATSEQLRDYFGAWLSMLRKHPDSYVQATLNNTYGYFFFNEQVEVLGAVQYYQKGPPVATGFFSYSYVDTFATWREGIKDWTSLTRSLPAVGLLYMPGFYGCSVIVLCGLLLRRRRWPGLIAMLPAVLTLAICVASPVNGLVRYALPLMATLPLLLAWTFDQLVSPLEGGPDRADRTGP